MCERQQNVSSTVSYPTVDELLSQQAGHHIRAEVNNVLDLPEGLLHCLQDKQDKQIISCPETLNVDKAVELFVLL